MDHSVDGLVAHYKFDEGQDAVVADYSGNGLHGAIIGEAQWTEGVVKGGLLFNGIDSYVNGDTVKTMLHVGKIAVTQAEVHLGHNSDVTDRFFNGILDEAMLFNRAVSDDEIKTIYASTKPTAVLEKEVSPVRQFVGNRVSNVKNMVVIR